MASSDGYEITTRSWVIGYLLSGIKDKKAEEPLLRPW